MFIKYFDSSSQGQELEEESVGEVEQAGRKGLRGGRSIL